MKDTARVLIGIIASLFLIAAGSILIYYTDVPMWVFWLVIIVALVIMMIPLVFVRKTSIVFGEKELKVRGPFLGVDIPYSAIQGVEFRTSFKPGLRLFGYNTVKRGSGTFRNEEFGSYLFTGTTAIPAFVVIRHKQNDTLVFNCGDAAETERLYSEIKSKTGSGTVLPVVGKTASNTRLYIAGIGIVSIVAIIAVFFVLFSAGHVVATLDDDSLCIDAVMMHEDVLYTDIDGTPELRENMDYGSRRAGYGGMGYLSGKFSNSEFGTYSLAVHDDVSKAIVVTYGSGDHLVFNLASNGETESFYTDLISRL